MGNRVLLSLKLHSDLVAVILSVLVQVPLAVFLGHAYDQTSFLDTGHIVSAGLNPYQHYMTTIFSPRMVGINPIIGDPPLWPLLLGAIYRLTYNVVPNIFLYNFAVKVPVIIANIVLAYAVRNILRRQGASEEKIKFAWIFLLFNPFLLLTSAAWGQFDTLIALLCVVSIFFLSRGKIKTSAILLSLSVVLKQISFPLLGLPLLFSEAKNWKKTIQYSIISVAVVLSLWVFPFYLFGWVLPSSGSQLTSFFVRAGGMTPFSIVEVLQGTVTLPAGLQFLGYLWIPALIAGYYFVYRDPPKSFNELTQKAIGLMLIFFLTYSWLSEPYVIIVIALVLLTLPFTKLSFRDFHFLWVIPLVFMVITTNFAQLFYLLSSPSLVSTALAIENNIREWRLIARFIVVVVWQVFAWRLVVKILSKRKNI